MNVATNLLVHPGDDYLNTADILYTLDVRIGEVYAYLRKILRTEQGSDFKQHSAATLFLDKYDDEWRPEGSGDISFLPPLTDEVEAVAQLSDEFNDEADLFLTWMEEHYENICDLYDLLDRAREVSGGNILPNLFIEEAEFDHYAVERFIEVYEIQNPVIPFLDELKIIDDAENSHYLETLPYSKCTYLWAR